MNRSSALLLVLLAIFTLAPDAKAADQPMTSGPLATRNQDPLPPQSTPSNTAFWQTFGGVYGGCDGTVWDMAVTDNGDIFLAGDFDWCGDVRVNHIARFDGTNFHALGDPDNPGLSDSVYAVKTDGNLVYVGGRFDKAGDSEGAGAALNSVARWDGSTWNSMSGGLSDTFYGRAQVQAIAILKVSPSESLVYVGGTFTDAGKVAAFNIAAWSSSTQQWQDLDDTPSNNQQGDTVYALAIDNRDGRTDLYVGGKIASIGNVVAANNIARWDGQNWHTLDGTGPSTNNSQTTTVKSLFRDGSSLYVSGTFSSVAGIPNTASLALYSIDGNSWSSVVPADSVLTYLDDVVLTGGALFALSRFRDLPHGGGYTLGAFRGNEWSYAYAEGSADDNRVVISSANQVSMLAHNGKLYIGGNLASVGGQAASGFAELDLTTGVWKTFGATENANGLRRYSIPAQVYAIASVGNDVYVGGDFNYAGNVSANGIARWDGSQWHQLGTNFDSNGVFDSPFNGSAGLVKTLLKITRNGQPYLVVGGNFEQIGDRNGVVDAENIAVWNPGSQTWINLDFGIGGTSVNALARLDDDDLNILVGGNFQSNASESESDVTLNNLARWSFFPPSWHPISVVDGAGEVGLEDDVQEIIKVGNGYYIGGQFVDVGGVTVNHITKMVFEGDFTQARFSALKPAGGTAGIDVDFSRVTALAADQDYLYVSAENFTSAGGVSVNNIARWHLTNETWSPLGTGLTGNFGQHYADALVVFNNQLYAGGDFDEAGGISASGFAAWDIASERWQQAGSGVNLGGAGSSVEVTAMAVTEDSKRLYLGGQDLRTVNSELSVALASYGLDSIFYSSFE